MTRKALPPYVYKKVAKDRTYYRFERGNISAVIDPNAPDFLAKYQALRDKKVLRAPKGRTFKALVADYKDGDSFKALAPRTKDDYCKVLDRILAKLGNEDPAEVRKVHVVEWQRKLTGRFASYFVQVLSVLMNHACDIGWRDDNPCKDVKRKQTAKKAPHVVWTDEALATFRAEASKQCRLILELGLGTVQRPDDWTRFNWEDFDGASIRLKQGKTGRELVIPLLPATIAILEANRPKVMNLRGKTPILMTGRRRMVYRRMAEIMLAERQRLGVEAHDLHALRYRGVMELAFAGCTDEEIGSISGHLSKAMIAKYAGMARQIMLARSAIAKRGA